MRRTWSFVRSTLVVTLVAVAPGAWPGASRAAEYSLAIVPQFEQRRLLDTWRPIADELERQGIQRALLELAATEAGRALFAKVPMKEPGPATADDYRVMLGWGLDPWYDPRARLE